jgi:hypothetical protein
VLDVASVEDERDRSFAARLAQLVQLSRLGLSSSKYRRLSSANFAGSWPNQRRSASPGKRRSA